MGIEELDQLGEVRKRSGQAVDFVDDNDLDFAGSHIVKQALQSGPLSIAARKSSIVVFSPYERPTGMGLAAYVGVAGVVLRVERVEVLLQSLIGRDPGIDCATHMLRRSGLHADVPLADLSRSPKNRGPFQRVPVIAKATCERLR
jgi:hypothetical protein